MKDLFTTNPNSKSRVTRILIYLILFFPLLSVAQKPDVKVIDKIATPQAEKISLKGSGFGTDATKINVFFGAAKGTVSSVTDQLIEALVPPGATYDHVIATNISNGLSGYTQEPFLLSFSGTHGFNPANLQAQFDTFTENGLYDICLCDFNLDNKVDIVAANNNANFISILRNNSTIGTYSFTKVPINIGAKSIHTRCGDLNGDGLQDFVVSEGGSGNRIFIFKNLGAFTFSQQTITLAGKQTKRLEIADIDQNGKPEVVITDQGSGNIIVLVNQSTLASITFAPLPLIVPVTGAASTDGLAVRDLDNDHFPEIIVNQFLTATGNLFIIKNESVPGNIKLDTQVTLTAPGTFVNIQVGDLDGDSKPDIATTQLLANSISVFRNTSTTSLSFSAPQTILTDDRPWGIDFGDLDGDSKPDVVVASITKKSITVLNNESTPGTLSFQKSIIPTTYINRHVRIGDIDGDGKPDVAFTSVDDTNNSIMASKVSVMRNAACMVPVATPPGPLTICSGFPLRLFSTVGGGVTYDWKQNNIVVYSGPNAYYDVSASGQYTVTETSEAGNCVKTSNTVDVTVGTVTPLGPATATNNGPICSGGTLQLSVNNVGATTYQWTGPQGYTGTGLTPSPITNFTVENSGRYSLDILVGGCLAQQTSTIAEVIDIPTFQVSVPGSGIVCQEQTTTLSIVPNSPNFTYQWFEESTGAIMGATASSVVVGTSGNYYAQMQSIPFPACAPVKSDTANVQVVIPPVASFASNNPDCVNQTVSFTDQSTTDNTTTAFFSWNFGDGNSSTDQNATHTFGSVGNFNVQFTVAYAGGACSNSVSKIIGIEAPPALTITSPGNTFTLCEGTPLQLDATGTFVSYLWSTTETTASITVTTAGSYSVQATASNHCIVSANQTITSLPTPTITVVADPVEIGAGESSQLSATGVDNYQWSPGNTLSDSTIANPVATPLETTTYTVSGNIANGCDGVATLEIKVKGKALVDTLTPSNFFSPNGDAANNYWEIKNIQNLPQCGVTIYDDKGIKVFEAKPYLNTWDGTFNGKILPDGVYYYIIRCEGEENIPKTGSITVIR